MCTENSIVINNVFACVFGILIGMNVVSAIKTSSYKTGILNNQNHHFQSLKGQLLDPVGETIRDKKSFKKSPSKRFDQYLTMARDVLQNRGSYVKSIRSPTIKEETTLVPLVDHFAGIRTWSVPYNDINKDSSNIQSLAENTDNSQARDLLIKTSPSEGSSIAHKTKETLSSKESLFDKAYIENRDIVSFAPDITMIESSVQNPRFDTISNTDVSSDTDFNQNKMVDSYIGKYGDTKMWEDQIPDLDTLKSSAVSKLYSDILSQEELKVLLKTRNLLTANGKHKAGYRRDYSDFGTFQSYDGGDYWSGSDLDGFSGGSSFGKFSHDHSASENPFPGFTSEEAKWGQAKNRDLESQFSNADMLEAFRPIGTFQSEGSFSNDESDCEDIETRSCSTDADCSCYGLYQCTDGMCSSKSPVRTISSPDTSRDIQEDGFWNSGPYTDEELGVNN